MNHVVPFDYFMASINLKERSRANKETFKELKALMSKSLRFSADKEFREVHAEIIARCVISADLRRALLFANEDERIAKAVGNVAARLAWQTATSDQASIGSQLKAMLANSQSKYSKFAVSAAVVDESGRVHL